MWIDDLAEVMPPPHPGDRGALVSKADWVRAETGLGFPLPADFRAFMDRWGPGTIGGFITFFTPAAGYHRVVTLPGCVLAQAGAYGELKAHHPGKFPWPAFPECGSFMPLGVTDNGDYLGLNVRAEGPDTWPVASFDDEYRRLETFEGLTFGPFLLALVTGRLRPEAFPDDIWDALPMTFARLKPQQDKG